MNTLEILKAARQLITPPEAWTQNVFARDRDGEEVFNYVGHSYETAVCYCSLGAIEAVSQRSFLESDAADILRTVINPTQENYQTPADFNDSHTHEEVLAVFDKAIELAEKGFV